MLPLRTVHHLMFLQVFEEVYELKVDEDVNRVLLALPRESPAPKDSLVADLRSKTHSD